MNAGAGWRPGRLAGIVLLALPVWPYLALGEEAPATGSRSSDTQAERPTVSRSEHPPRRRKSPAGWKPRRGGARARPAAQEPPGVARSQARLIRNLRRSLEAATRALGRLDVSPEGRRSTLLPSPHPWTAAGDPDSTSAFPASVGAPNRPRDGAPAGSLTSSPAPEPAPPLEPPPPTGPGDPSLAELPAPSDSDEIAPESDPLRLGGMLYQRAISSIPAGDRPADYRLSTPTLVDVFLDSRPNNRVRGMIAGRLHYDPALPRPQVASDTPAMSGYPTSLAAVSRGPSVALDQLWLRFDVKHLLFVIAGKQHVRWGTGRVWAPADFLHGQRRNPLERFDARAGTTMLKLHVPWESTGANFYACGLLDDSEPRARLGDVAGAARAEVVLGTAEVGATVLVQLGRRPKLGFDASAGFWNLDVHAEAALRDRDETDRVTVAEAPAIAPGSPGFIEQRYPATPGAREYAAQVVGGLAYNRRYGDNDMLTIGLEYFHNPLGYGSSDVYPGVLLARPTLLRDPGTFFYLGRQYGAAFLAMPAPFSWNHTTFALTMLTNLSDGSYVSRIDYTFDFFSNLRLEAFAALHHGRQGEFRLVMFGSPDPLLDVGLALRVSL
jgi:hypothetical protein